MAKKKAKSTAQNIKKDSMVAKVEVKNPQDQERISRIVGTMFIVFGVILISFGIYSFIRYNRNPELNPEYQPPVIIGLKEVTNDELVTIKGSAIEYEKVFVYINGQEVERVNVSKDGSYEYTTPLEEGQYMVSVAGVKGFPKRYISPQTTGDTIIIDRTAPTLSDIKYPIEVGTKTFTVTGKIEKNAAVSIKRGTDVFGGVCDEEGNFKVSGIRLDEGSNIFTVVIRDEAGNEVVSDKKIKTIYSSSSSVNGDAVSDSTIPVADGNLDSAKMVMLGNILMIVFGIVALLGASGSTIYMLNKKRG